MAKKSELKRRLPLVGIFLLLIIGICFFMYPIVSNWISEYSAHAVIRHYDDRVQKMGDNAIQKIASQAEEYNKALANNDTEKISVFTYNEMLSVTDAIGYIDIPKIGVYTPVYHGLGDSELQKGIGHMEGTSLPIGGESTHCVLAGHTGLPGSKLFTDIDTLREGDAFYIHVLDRVLKYRVDQIKVVLPNDSEFRHQMDAHPARNPAANGHAQERKWNVLNEDKGGVSLNGASLHMSVLFFL